MEQRYKARLRELLDDAVVQPDQLHGMLTPFGAICGTVRDLPSALQGAHAPQAVRSGAGVAGRSQECGIDHVPSRPRSAAVAGSSRVSATGTIGRWCASWCDRSARYWCEQAQCWCLILPRFPKRTTSGWVCSGNGAGGWKRLRIARSAFTWHTFRPRNMCWWARGCTCRKVGALQNASDHARCAGQDQVPHAT
jgi:hypothetical protein